ncbi:MAG: capsule assembly Wzi family protein [Pseudomonadota bacterium]
MMKQILLHCFLFVFFQEVVQASISNDVPPLLPNAGWVDRIEAYGCSARTFRAFQPQSHADLLEALMLFADAQCEGPEWLLAEREILGRSYLQSEARAFALIAKDKPLSLLGIAAQVDPFQSLREGRGIFGGPSVYGELNFNSQLIQGREWGIAVSATPGFVLAHENSSHLLGKFYFQEGAIKAGYRRTELVFGRIPERFGEAKNGNLIFSGAHRPINMLKFAVRPHWIKPLSFLGPVAFQTWIGSDGSEESYKNARLWAIQLGMRPFTFFEWGFLNLMQFGGVGAPALDFADYFAMLGGSQDAQLRQKRHQSYATHVAFWGPKQNFKLYNQLFVGSLGRLNEWFSRDISWLIGLWFPKLGAGDARLEVVSTRAGAYSDSRWTQGWAHAGSPLGHPLGNSALGIYLDFSLPLISNWRSQWGVSYESRNRDKLKGLETETRWSSSVSAIKRFEMIELDLQVKAQRIENRDYLIHEPEVEAGAFAFLRYSFL